MTHDHLSISIGCGDLRLFHIIRNNLVSDINIAYLIIIIILGSNIRACMN